MVWHLVKMICSACVSVIIFGFYQLAFAWFADASLRKVPIGAIYDERSNNVEAAFRYAVSRFNRRNGEFQLDYKHNMIQISDSFSLSNTICSQLSDRVYAIFGVTNVTTSSTIQSYASAFHVPFITTSMPRNYSQPSPFLLRMRPVYTQALLDLMKHFDWRKVKYIYDSDEGLIRVQQLFEDLNKDVTFTVNIDPTRVTDARNAMDILKSLHKRDTDTALYILLDIPVSDAEDVLYLTYTDPELQRGKFHYVLTGLGMLEMNLTKYEIGGLNVIGFQIVDFSNVTVKIFLEGQWENMDPSNWAGAGTKKISYEAALAIDSLDLFSRAMQHYRKLMPDYHREFLASTAGKHGNRNRKCSGNVVVTPEERDILLKVIKETEFDGLTGKISFDRLGFRKDFSLNVMQISINRIPSKIGYWTPNEKFVPHTPLVYRPNTNASVSKIQRVTTIVDAPYVILREQPKDGRPLAGNERFEGYCVELARKVAEKVNYTYVVMIVKDGKYGRKQKNDSWNGMVGELIRHEADIAIAPLTITSQRERAIDFSKPFMSLGVSIMIKIPDNQTPGVFSFMDPLSYEIWMCITFAYIGVSVVLFLVTRFSPYEWHLDEYSSIANDFSIVNSFWFSLGAIMQQGCEISPRSVSGRIVGSVWWFFTLIIISSYTANLAAFLTVERMSTPIESAEDLAKQTVIQYGTIGSGSTYTFFSGSRMPLYERMFAYMTAQPTVFVKNNKKGIEKVRNSKGEYAFLLESVTNDYHNQREPCNTMKVGNNLDSKGFGIATPIGSPLRDELTLAVLNLRESRELDKMFKYWWNERGQCGDTTKGSKDVVQTALTLDNVAGIFYILIGGLVLSVIMAFSEFIYKSKVDSKRAKTTFGSALRSKARMSFKGHAEDKERRYSYTAPSQVISLDGYRRHPERNTHTQV